MFSQYKVIILPYAALGLQNAFEYMAFQLLAGPDAVEWYEGALEQINALSTLPLIHPIIEGGEFEIKKYRRLRYRKHLIIYTVSEKEKIVYVHSVVYARRNIAKAILPEA